MNSIKTARHGLIRLVKEIPRITSAIAIAATIVVMLLVVIVGGISKLVLDGPVAGTVLAGILLICGFVFVAIRIRPPKQ